MNARSTWFNSESFILFYDEHVVKFLAYNITKIKQTFFLKRVITLIKIKYKAFIRFFC